MNLLKQMLVDNLSDRQLLVLRGLKRWVMRQPPITPDPAPNAWLPFDVAGSIPHAEISYTFGMAAFRKS